MTITSRRRKRISNAITFDLLDDDEPRTQIVDMPIRHDMDVMIELPLDMTTSEAVRICQLVCSMVRPTKPVAGFLVNRFSSLN